MKGELRKDQILNSSRKIFSNKGYYETYVEDVIKEAKVGKGTFYRYFKNKEDLFVSLLRKHLQEWEKAVFIELNDFKEGNLREYFHEIVKRSFYYFAENEDLCNIYLRVGPGINKTFEPLMQQFEEQITQHIVQYLKQGIKLGQFKKKINLELTSNAIVGAFFRVDYHYFVLKKTYKKNDIKKLANDFFDIIMNGIASN